MNSLSNQTRDALTVCDHISVQWGVMDRGVMAFLYGTEDEALNKQHDLRAAGIRGVKIVPVQIRNG